MTMFSAENRGFYNCGYGGGGYVEGLGGSVMNYHLQGGYDYSCNSEACIGSDLAAVGSLMAEDDESRINQSSSKDAKEERDEGWLQLSIGSHSHEIKQDLGNIDHQSPQREVGPGLNIELQLMPSLNSNTNTTTNNNSNNSHSQISQIRPLVGMPEVGGPVMNYAGFSFLQNSSSSSSYNFPQLQHQEIINWGLIRPISTINTPTPSSYSNFSSSSPLIPSSSSYIYQSPRPFQLYVGPRAAAPPLDFRVIQPPTRPNSGIWFMLQASQNQEKEQILPQISKSYLRIKDGRMTVRLVMKYLINKLRLENESEIEIRCKGQRLLPFLTLQHVRDNIWSPRDFVTLLPNSSTTDHIMVLHYARIFPSN